MRKPLVGAVIAAGGMAQRMQGIDKQQLVIGGVPVLARSILALGQVEQVSEIVVVTKPELFETLEGWRERYHLPPFLLAAGGSTRPQSAQAGWQCFRSRWNMWPSTTARAPLPPGS